MLAPAGPLLGRFHKGPDMFYREICDTNCAIFGLPAPYVPDMRVHDLTDNAIRFADPELFYRQDLWIIGSGVSLHAQTTLQSATGDWVRITLIKRRADNGGIDGETSTFALDGQYRGWLQRLDRERETLTLDNGTVLTRAELRLVHAALHGIPDKVTAATRQVSVSDLQRNLRHLRAKLEHPGCDCRSLAGCVNWHGLTRFIMDNADWFDSNPTLRFFPGRHA
ncbi:MAG: hypothetical protein CME59_22215 [Halioglobus sp.]|nr:hypothetical protein [Halioglobus sp.]|tara:strand:+ start:181 stop:849 length:669 start_codon:yes stop_codon:yes gene_type:complete